MTPHDHKPSLRDAEAAYRTAPTKGASPLLLKVGLCVTVALIGAGIVEKAAATLGIWLHLLSRIYDGRFSGRRRVTWLVLVFGLFASFAIGFLGYVLPWGQISFWLAARLGEPGWALMPILFGLRPLVGVLVWSALLADMFALHAAGLGRWRVLRNTALLALLLVAPGVLSDVLHLTGVISPASPSGADSLLTPRKIIPDLNELPFYAVLRAVPSKTLGVSLVVTLMLLPLAAAVSRAWRFHAAQTWIVWTSATAALAASWLGLAVLGASPPPETEGPRWAVLALVAYQIVFFTGLPVVLGRYARPEDHRASVFD